MRGNRPFQLKFGIAATTDPDGADTESIADTPGKSDVTGDSA